MLGVLQETCLWSTQQVLSKNWCLSVHLTYCCYGCNSGSSSYCSVGAFCGLKKATWLYFFRTMISRFIVGWVVLA
jgi:hypothetical protein